MATPAIHAAPPHRLVLIALGLFTIACVGFAAIGQGGPLSGRVASVVIESAYSGWMPAVYLFGAFGFGSLFRPIVNNSPSNTPLFTAVGIAMTLTITHLLGILGLLTTTTAWATTGLGILLTIHTLRASRPPMHIDRDPYTIALLMMLAVGLGVFVVAAANPPGALWDSEFGAYDSLSYHLQLPKEWIASGHIWPSTHNVYSFHPGYIESSYMHLALLGNQQLPLQSTHFLSMLLVMIGAWNGAHAARQWSDSPLAPILTAAMIMLTPWIMVIGTISYNESGVIALASGALVVAARKDLKPSVRGLLAGILVGAACSSKMTTIFFVAPSIAVILFASTPKKSWFTLIWIGSLTGIAMISPWMIRNMVSTGNPVFPHASSIFGSGHWSAEQLARFASAHHFDGTALDRLAMLVFPDPNALTAVHVARFHGLTNLQWGLLPIATAAALCSMLACKGTRRLGVVFLIAITVPIIAWLLATHLQSRFFVPMVPLAACVVGIGFGKAKKLAIALALASLVWSGVIFASQSRGNPNALLAIDTIIHTDPMLIDDQPTPLSWTAAINMNIAEDQTIALIGDATPFYLRPTTVYSTTYDTPAIAAFIDQFPNQPARWVAGLANQGIDWIVINTAELDRLTASGWNDPRISPTHIQQLTDTLDGTDTIVLDPFRTAYRITDLTAP